MTSKERVCAALRKEPVDRVPIFMWFHPETTKRLARLLEIPPEFVGQAMGNDVVQAWVNNNYAMEGIVHEKDSESHVDAWGIKWVKEGPFNQIAEYPLKSAGRERLLAYRFPYEHADELVAKMAAPAAKGDDVFVGCDVSPCVFEMYWRLRGMEETMTEMAAEPDLAREMFKRCADFAIAVGERACRQYKLDWFWTGDDVASQQCMMMSPKTWRDLVKPELSRVFEVGRSRGLYIAYHSCGSIRPIIADLIEMGLDVLNPIQCNCPGMDPLELKREFGNDLAFMGGVDTQDLLPRGQPAEVRRATSRLISNMTSDGGGYILAASHSVPPETPDENIFAMYDAAGLGREKILDAAADIRASLKSRRPSP
jgi:uroporphyrinogen decarboxylase